MNFKNGLYLLLSYLLTFPYLVMAQGGDGAGGGAYGAANQVTGGVGWWWFWGIALLVVLAFIIWYLARTPTTRTGPKPRGPGMQGT